MHLYLVEPTIAYPDREVEAIFVMGHVFEHCDFEHSLSYLQCTIDPIYPLSFFVIVLFGVTSSMV